MSADVTPIGDLEASVAALFAEALELEHVAGDADFFVLGGQSLLAMRLVWSIRTTYDVELRVKSLFDNPTPREMAALVAAERAAS